MRADDEAHDEAGAGHGADAGNTCRCGVIGRHRTVDPTGGGVALEDQDVMLPEGLALDSLLLDSELSGEGMPSGKSPETTVEEPTAEPTVAPTAEPVDEVEGSAEEPIEIPDEPTGVNAEGALDEIALDTTEPTLEGIEADSEIVEDSLAQFELFDQSATVDGVVSSVSAPAGVFPADAVLSEKNPPPARRSGPMLPSTRHGMKNRTWLLHIPLTSASSAGRATNCSPPRA